MAKVLCVVLDGICSATLDCVHVRCLERLMGRGVFYRNLRPVVPRLGLPALNTLFCSCHPARHGVLTDSGAGHVPVKPPSLLSLLRYQNRQSAMFYSAEAMAQLAPPGSMDTSVLINNHGLRNVDGRLASAAARYLQLEQPDFCLLSLQGAETAGTHFGFMSAPYLESVEQADHVLDLILAQMGEVGVEREYSVVVLASHAGSWEQDPEAEPSGSSGLPLIISVPGTVRGRVVDRAASMLDLAPTMARILGVAPHPDWQGRVLGEVFSPGGQDDRGVPAGLAGRVAVRPAA